MIIAVNYADKSFAKAQQLNLETARQHGADMTVAYTPDDIGKWSVFMETLFFK